MKPQSIVGTLLHAVLGGVFCLALGGCHSHPAASPGIEFTHIPPAAQGGRERVDTISGHVQGARAGQQIVIYARSGPWWVQPWPDKPFLPIHADSSWSTETHLGFEYAALLVDPGYHPPPTMDVAPTTGGAVSLVKIVKGTGEPQYAPTKAIHFSGYDWRVRTIAADRGGVNNLFSGDNAWVDAQGALHLRIARQGNRWTCAQVVLPESLGYGTYVLTLRDTSKLEPAAMFSMTTFDDWAGDQYYRELDLEVGRWGNALSSSNAQYGVQPFYIPGNVFSFKTPAGRLTYAMQWESGRASFKGWHGASITPGAAVVAQHEFTSGIPTPGREYIQLLLFVVASERSPLHEGNEVVIEKFQYLP
jgi:hypothetical protein